MKPAFAGIAAATLLAAFIASPVFGQSNNGATAPVVTAAAPADQAVEPKHEPAAEQPAPSAGAAADVSDTKPATGGTAEEVKPVAPKPPEITLTIDIDLSRQQMTIKERGKVVGAWPISSGRSGYRTPTGTFRPLWQSHMWYSKKYDNAPMPHSVFFNGGVAMHATQATGMLGRPASHGCVRQSPANAAKTYALVSKHGYASTRIVVHGSPRDEAPSIARRGRDGVVNYAARTQSPYAYQPTAGTRRVVFVDQWGNRRIGTVAANDPRLGGYRAYQPRPYASSYPFW